MSGLLAANTGTNVALIIALCSAGIALTSLTWNLLLYRLSGSRLNVRLIPAVLTVRGDLIRGPDRGWPAKHFDLLPEVHAENGYVDLAIIKVTNVGRVAVSVSDIVLDLGHTSWRWWWRRTIGGTPVVVHECKNFSDAVRLEAGQSLSVAVDHEPLVRYIVRQADGKRVTVRGSATAAGRRPTRSSWLKRWKVESERSIYFGAEPDAEHEAFAEVFRAVYPTRGWHTRLGSPSRRCGCATRRREHVRLQASWLASWDASRTLERVLTSLLRLTGLRDCCLANSRWAIGGSPEEPTTSRGLRGPFETMQ